MNFKKKISLLILFVFFLTLGMVSANSDSNDTLTTELPSYEVTINDTIIIESPSQEVTINDSIQDEISSSNEDIVCSTCEDTLDSEDDFIVVNDWNELQYYCSLTDKNYNLKLKENTNFYPNNPSSSSYQIKIKNNVKIMGSNDSWIGDSSSNPRSLMFIAIIVEDDARAGLILDNVTFKWIKVAGGFNLPDGRFIYVAGKKNSVIKNCKFYELKIEQGHSCIVHLSKGTMTLDNCSFIKCNTKYGCLSVYGSSPHMTVQNCYFENNYANNEPGCINNCAKLTVYNTTFYKNRAGTWAGAIHTHSGASSTIYDSKFIDNVAGWNGGALYTYGNLKIYNSIFRGNNCTTNNGGGAIGACEYGSQPHIYIEKCLFEKNSNNCWALDSLSTEGTGRGGAVSLMDTGSLEVRDTVFIANSASIGTAICAKAVEGYGTPDVILVNNSFINHTRVNDVLVIQLWDSSYKNISDNYYYGNSIVLSNLTLTKLSEGREQASFEITVELSNPSYYDDDILNKTLYDVYINGKYVKTVNSTIFTIDFGDFDICEVYVIPTISNRKSNSVTAVSTREYIFVSKSNGDDNNNGISRDSPVSTIQKALQLAGNCQNIILLDGEFSENLQITYDITIKGECNATLTDYSTFTVNTTNFILKNLNINKLLSDTFIKCNTNLSVSNCIFTDNHAILINNSGFTNIKDSILLNNSNIIINDNYDLNYNWWGSTLENQNKPVDLNINNWLVLNASSNTDSLEINQMAEVRFAFYLNDGVKYNNLRLINLNLRTVNGTVKNNITSSDSKVTFTLTALGNGLLVARYNNIQTSIGFNFMKSNPDISLTAEDIMYGDNLTVKVTAPSDAAGNVTVKVSNQTQTLPVTSPTTVFTFTNLKADNYIIQTTYSGDDKYLNQTANTPVAVAKYDSNTLIGLSPVAAGEDLIISINVNSDAGGNVTLYINSQVETLTLINAFANYTIKKISRGDYLIRAVYNGDDKYLSSLDSRFIEVDNLNATMEITADNITYGAPAIIKIKLNDDATGNVSITIDGITNSSKVTDGSTEVSIYNLDAGTNKDITVFYTGDDTYFNLTKGTVFTINKADLTFNISSSDIMIGQNAVIKITVPKRTTGTFTIGQMTSNIPLSGEVEFILTDLEIGEYEYTAVYNGNNYNTVHNSTSFEVKEYPTPQVANTENNGKSEYFTNANGEIVFTIPINESVNGITVDSEGNIYITTNAGIYSYANDGTPRWNFTSNSVMGNFSASVIGRDVIITPKSGDTLYFINQSSGERYGSSNIYQASSLFAPIIDSNANLYILSELQVESNSYKLVIVPYKLWENGGDPILVDLGKYEPVTALTVSDDFIVVLMDGRIRLIDAKTLQTKYTKSGDYQKVRPLLDDGGIAYCILGDSVVAYSSGGSQLWKTKITGGVGNQLLLDSEVGLYTTNAKGNLYRYDLATGRESLVSDLKVTSGVVIDADHNLFFGCDDIFYEITSEGKILWKADLNNTMTGKPVMDKNGTIYVSSIDNRVYGLTHGDLKDPNLNMTINGDVLTITVDDECVGGISFNLNGKTYTSTTVSIADLPGGTYSINVTYDGDGRFAKTSEVFTFFVKSKINNVQTTVQGSSVTFTLPGDATGTLTIKANGQTYTKTLTNGKATITLSDGTYNAVVTYEGNSKYAGFTKTVKLTVKNPVKTVKKSSKIVAKKKTFKAKTKTKKYTVTLKSGKTPIKKVKLTIKIKKKTYKATTNSKGKATFKITKLNKGKYTAVIRFAGNSLYKAASKKVKIVVK